MKTLKYKKNTLSKKIKTLFLLIGAGELLLMSVIWADGQMDNYREFMTFVIMLHMGYEMWVMAYILYNIYSPYQRTV